MRPYLAFDLDAKKKVTQVARAWGKEPGIVAWGLLEAWERVWLVKNDVVTTLELAGAFGPNPPIDLLVVYGFIEPATDLGQEGELCNRWRMKGADKYLKIHKAQSEAGKAKIINLRRGQEPGRAGETKEAAPAKPEVEPGDSRESGPALSPNTQHPIKKEKAGGGKRPPPPPDPLVELWNLKAHPNCPRVLKVTPGRRKSSEARRAEHPMGDIERAIDQLNLSPLCIGEVPGKDGAEPWVANFDWLVKPDSIVKLLEGRYRGGRGPQNPQKAFDPDQGIMKRPPVAADAICDFCGRHADAGDCWGHPICYPCWGASMDEKVPEGTPPQVWWDERARQAKAMGAA